jgi:hypothetical protein
LTNAPYYAHQFFEPDNEFYAAVNALPDAQQWSVMDQFRATNGCHFFVACRPERPKESYVIDFASTAALEYVPVFRKNCGFQGDAVFRPDWRKTLAPGHAELLCYVDGSRCIREIAEQAGHNLDEARQLFEGLWRLDFLAATIR